MIYDLIIISNITKKNEFNQKNFKILSIKEIFNLN